MAAATEEKHRKTYCRKPNLAQWASTLLIITYAVCCLVMSILVGTGHILNTQGLDNGTDFEDNSWMAREAFMVYFWTEINLLACILLLTNIWIRKDLWILSLCGICVLFVLMVSSLKMVWDSENQEIEAFKSRYLILNTLIYRPGDTDMHFGNQSHYNVDRWQAEVGSKFQDVKFKCCGLTSHHDWLPDIPPTCLCEDKDDSSRCVAIGNSLVYEKPCFPTVLSLVEKLRSTFWIIMLTWTTIFGATFGIPTFSLVVCCSALSWDTCYQLSVCGEGKMVPAVFIRKENNDRTEDKRNEGEAKQTGSDEVDVVLDVEDTANVKGEGEAEEENPDDSPVRMIPLPLLHRLYEELDPPPVKHQVSCLCLFPSPPKNFYSVVIEADSPLLPSHAVLVDANKPPRHCMWVEGSHVFEVMDIIFPRGAPPPASNGQFVPVASI